MNPSLAVLIAFVVPFSAYMVKKTEMTPAKIKRSLGEKCFEVRSKEKRGPSTKKTLTKSKETVEDDSDSESEQPEKRDSLKSCSCGAKSKKRE